MERYSKLRRPTSLPIQPFVLLPTEKPQFQPPQQHLGGLLEQYLNQRSSKSANSQNGLKFKEKTSQCLSELQSSPVESLCPIFLDANSSSDTCSTCSPSPKCFSRRHMWRQNPQRTSHQNNLKSMVQSQENPNLNSSIMSNQPNLVRIPTYQDLITVQPERNKVISEPINSNKTPEKNALHSKPFHVFPITPESHVSNLRVISSPPKAQRPLPEHQQDQPLTAAARRSSLSSFLSSGLYPKQIKEPARLSPKPTQSQHDQSLILNNRLSAEFCLSPDTSYESMSISHLQRKGEGKLRTDAYG